jgi:hypothetical protein
LFCLQQILDIGAEGDFSEVSSTVNFHKFVVPANRFKKVEDEIEVVVSDLTPPWVGKTEASFERGQHECMLCIMCFRMSFCLTSTRAEPVSIKYNVVPTDPFLMMVAPLENDCT